MDAPDPVSAAAPATPLGWRAALIAYASYVAWVMLVTWPLAWHPASIWAAHTDPPLFTWVMASMARWLVAGPRALFDGNAFYPYGESLAFSEPLLLPALLGLPGFVWGNPVLTYNLLILLLWPVNGLAMAWVACELTASRRAAWLAGAVFSLSPYFVTYHLEFNMLPAAPVNVIPTQNAISLNRKVGMPTAAASSSFSRMARNACPTAESSSRWVTSTATAMRRSNT